MKSQYFTIIILAILTAWGAKTFGQSVKKADRRVTFYEYAVAIPVLEKIIEKDKDGKQEAMEMLADCYRLTNDADKAADIYSKVIKLDSINPIDYYYYGQVLRTLGKYKEAKKQFLKYAELVPDDPRGAQFAEFCDEIESWNQSAPENLVHNIASLNTENSDFSPVIYKNGVVFSSDRKMKKYLNPIYDWTGAPYLNFFFAGKDTTAPAYDPSYAEAESFSNKLNDEYHDGTATFNSTGDVIYFTRTIKKGVKDEDKIITDRLKIYTSRQENGKWTKAEPISLNNDNYSIGHPALSPDDKKLYFVSDMPGGYGGTDLYVSEWSDENEDWGEPKNLGPVINTPENEMFPYIHKDGTLYFASAGHLGYGGLDIFYAKQENGEWTKPVNMMAPMNSSYDDFGVTFVPGMGIGLFSSNRPGGAGKDDIYAFEGLVKMNGKVLACENGINCLPLENATVFILNKSTDKVSVIKTDAGGNYNLKVSPRADYAIKASKEGFFSDCSSIKTGNKDLTVRDLMLEKPKAGKVFTVDNIYYDFDKWFIREDAKPALNNLVRIMQESPITVELSSHTDCRGSDEYNMKLSQKRAQSAVDYIIENGIDSDRITAKGYGESKPVVVCDPCLSCTEEEHQLNRRTEFKIISVTPEPPPKEIDEAKYLNGKVYERGSFSKEFFEGCNFSEPLDN